MANITLSVDAEVLATVRRYAVDHDTTVNGLVRDFLTSLATQQDRARRARRRLLQLSDRSRARIGPRNWTRDDLHER